MPLAVSIFANKAIYFKWLMFIPQPDKTRNSSGDEIANVNFLCDDIVHALKIQ